MKKYFIISLLSLGLCSCASMSLPEKLDNFVDRAEIASENQTNDYDWQKSQEDFQILLDQFNSSDKKKYSQEEEQMAAKAIGRYHALLIKEGLEKSTDLLQNLGKIIPEYIDGLATELGKSEGIIRSLEQLIDTSAMQSSIEKLGTALENLFGTPETKSE